jgi:predicted Fe-Mo cluster-binding NifX family protein
MLFSVVEIGTHKNNAGGRWSMRVAISTQGNDLNAEVDPRFGRARNFILVETTTMKHQVIENDQSLQLPQGAGIQAAQNLLSHNPEVVLTGNCGPKAFRVLQAAKVNVVVGVKGKISDALRDFMEGKYVPTANANVEGHWG